MDQYRIMTRVDEILEQAKAGIMASCDSQGKPQMRWLTPALLKGRNSIFALTCPEFVWVDALRERPNVEWIIQTPALDEIVRLRGKIFLVDNPCLKSEILEAVGERLAVLWKVKCAEKDLIALETIIEDACYFFPMKAKSVVVKFQHKEQSDD